MVPLPIVEIWLGTGVELDRLLFCGWSYRSSQRLLIKPDMARLRFELSTVQCRRNPGTFQESFFPGSIHLFLLHEL